MAFLINIMGEKNNQWWGWGRDKEIPGSFSDYLSLMLGKPRIRLHNLKTSPRFPCATYSIIRNIDILLDSQYTGNKRVWRAEKFKQFINIVKFPQFFLPFSHVNTCQKKENLLQILNPFALGMYLCI